MLRVAIAAMMMMLTLGAHAPAATSMLTDVQAKLVIINHFLGQYTNWPGSYALDNLSEVNICSVGDDGVTSQLSLMEKASSKELKVNVLNHVSQRGFSRCHVLYIATSEQHRLQRILRSASAYPVLTISSIDGFITAGGMVGLEVQTKYQGTFEREFIRYSINLNALHKAKLSIHPDAMELAWKVVQP